MNDRKFDFERWGRFGLPPREISENDFPNFWQGLRDEGDLDIGSRELEYETAEVFRMYLVRQGLVYLDIPEVALMLRKFFALGIVCERDGWAKY